VKSLFELRETPAHRGLADPKSARRFRETAELGDGEEQPHIIPRNIHF
jgi:hypothetical protein